MIHDTDVSRKWTSKQAINSAVYYRVFIVPQAVESFPEGATANTSRNPVRHDVVDLILTQGFVEDSNIVKCTVEVSRTKSPSSERKIRVHGIDFEVFQAF